MGKGRIILLSREIHSSNLITSLFFFKSNGWVQDISFMWTLLATAFYFEVSGLKK